MQIVLITHSKTFFDQAIQEILAKFSFPPKIQELKTSKPQKIFFDNPYQLKFKEFSALSPGQKYDSIFNNQK